MQLELVGVNSQVETSWKWVSFSSLNCRKEPGLNMLGNLSFAVHDTSMVQSQLLFPVEYSIRLDYAVPLVLRERFLQKYIFDHK